MARIKPQALLQQSKKKKGPSRISTTTILLCSLVVLLTVFFLYSTYKHWYLRSRIQAESGESEFEKYGSCWSHCSTNSKNTRHATVSMNVRTISKFSSEDPSLGNHVYGDSKKSDLPGYAILDTSKGFVTVELFKDSSPGVVDKFIELSQNGRFKGMQFHRVIKHYVIQAGDSSNLGATEDWTLRGKHYNQLDTSLKHEAFMLGTSKANHDASKFELFITTAPIPDLNEKLIVFGRVIRGEDVIQEIEEVDTDEHYKPKSRVEIINVSLRHKI